MIFQITALFVTDIGFDYIAPDPTGDDLTSFFETVARKNWLDFDGVTFSGGRYRPDPSPPVAESMTRPTAAISGLWSWQSCCRRALRRRSSQCPLGENPPNCPDRASSETSRRLLMHPCGRQQTKQMFSNSAAFLASVSARPEGSAKMLTDRTSISKCWTARTEVITPIRAVCCSMRILPIPARETGFKEKNRQGDLKRCC